MTTAQKTARRTGRAAMAAMALGFALTMGASVALAAAPEPARRVDASNYSGRWYEIARLPNRFQRNCTGASVDYTLEGEKVRAVQRCAAVAGKNGRTFRSSGRILDPGTNAKVRLTFAGFWSQDYWILDNDPAARWAIVGDPRGRFVWIMFRDPTPGDAAVAAAVSRARALGYDTSRLEYAGQKG
ncbi:MAG: lipocalin family protein [Hyphomonadaceae bacterium]|nr:lipocalin family protein [Hyphomonadaceae bacterium]